MRNTSYVIRLRLISQANRILTITIHSLLISVSIFFAMCGFIKEQENIAEVSMFIPAIAGIALGTADFIAFINKGFSLTSKFFLLFSKGNFQLRWNFFDGLPPFNTMQEDMAIEMEEALNVEKKSNRKTKSFIVLGNVDKGKTTGVLQFLRSVMPTFSLSELLKNKWARDIIYMQCDHRSRSQINEYFKSLKSKKERENKLFSSELKDKLIIIDDAEQLGESFFVTYKNILKHSLGTGTFVLIFNESEFSGIKKIIAEENYFSFSKGT